MIRIYNEDKIAIYTGDNLIHKTLLNKIYLTVKKCNISIHSCGVAYLFYY